MHPTKFGSFGQAVSEEKIKMWKVYRRTDDGPNRQGELSQRLSRACIVHLVIKKNNWSYVKTMSCSVSHLGITINIKNTKFVKDLPMIDA